MTSIANNIADILEPLTEKQRLYVQARLQGLTKVASAAAAGSPNPKKNAHKFETSEVVKAALRQVREISAQQLEFDRKKAHDMYMDAYRSADTATEQKMAVFLRFLLAFAAFISRRSVICSLRVFIFYQLTHNHIGVFRGRKLSHF